MVVTTVVQPAIPHNTQQIYLHLTFLRLWKDKEQGDSHQNGGHVSSCFIDSDCTFLSLHSSAPALAYHSVLSESFDFLW